MKNIELSFIMSGIDLDNKPINPVQHNVTLIDVPKHIIIECAKRYITTCIQSHFRRGLGEYGKIGICGEMLTYR